jgi:hypothetical protein
LKELVAYWRDQFDWREQERRLNAFDHFNIVMKKLVPQAQVVSEGWPKLGTTDFTTHITKAISAKPDLLVSSVWGGDYVAMYKQGLRYDLASAYAAAGEEDRALSIFTDLYGQNASFRDVAAKVRELRAEAVRLRLRPPSGLGATLLVGSSQLGHGRLQPRDLRVASPPLALDRTAAIVGGRGQLRLRPCRSGTGSMPMNEA